MRDRYCSPSFINAPNTLPTLFESISSMPSIESRILDRLYLLPQSRQVLARFIKRLLSENDESAEERIEIVQFFLDFLTDLAGLFFVKASRSRAP